MKERATIVCRRDDKILLVTRERSHWSLPGGTIRRSELPLEAARRELEEETTLVVERLEYQFQFGGLSKRHHVYLVDLPKGAVPIAANEISRCRWFRPERVSALIVSVPTRGIVELMLHHDIALGATPVLAPSPITTHEIGEDDVGDSHRQIDDTA